MLLIFTDLITSLFLRWREQYTIGYTCSHLDSQPLIARPEVDSDSSHHIHKSTMAASFLSDSPCSLGANLVGVTTHHGPYLPPVPSPAHDHSTRGLERGHRCKQSPHRSLLPDRLASYTALPQLSTPPLPACRCIIGVLPLAPPPLQSSTHT